MTTQPAPPRWVESPEDAPAGFQQSAAAYAEFGPSQLVRAQSFEVLQARLSQRSTASGVWRLLTWGGLVVLAVGVVAVVRQPPNVQGTRPVPAAAAVERPEPMQVAAPAGDDRTVPTVATARPVSGVPENRRFARAARKALHKASAASPSLPSATPLAIAELRSELQLLTRARHVVRSSPSRAIALTAEHAERYPAGTFAEEREVIAVEALVRLGQREQAAARARAFGARFPQSAHRQRIEDVLAAP